MLVWGGAKWPVDQEPFDIDWTGQLGTDTVVGSTWSIISGDSQLQIVSNTFTTTRTQITLAGGTEDANYILQNIVTTAAGNTLCERVVLPMGTGPKAGDLVPLSRALDWLGLTSDPDCAVQRIISGISGQVTNYLGYSLAKADYTRTFDGEGTRLLFVPDLPLNSVSSVTIDGHVIPVSANGSFNPGYSANAYAVAVKGYRFTRGFQNVTLVYNSGYATVPDDIVQACLNWIKDLYLQKQMTAIPTNVTSVRAGDTQYEFANPGSSTTSKMAQDDPQIPVTVLGTLSSYKRTTPSQGVWP
ncbi:hypothetical protein HU675_0038235 [Bradyrhizobium septentrionale]|uniref:phage fiber-tail adaptor protein n=1 Tax=Bradyrhizobium septentrionale TaxID=1404411 RepID=UPI001596C492|nr:hypothetical protein [Bradyrhizobium septentrionale]UGY23726.1 hypothetical protein HU675_0038235 [Bradyrhizobium septentrionale]